MDPLSSISEELAQISGQVADIFLALSKGFQNLERIKDVNRQSRQLEELAGKMRECKRLIKEFDREVKDMESRNDTNTNKMLNEKKQSMIKELNSYVALKKQYTSNLENNKRVDLFDGPNEELHDNNILLASSMSNQQIMDHGNQMMDETDQAIERGKKVVQDTVNVGRETAVALKAQTEQMSRIVNELDSIHFSIKKASKMVKEIGRQVATDKCIMAVLFLIVIGVIAIIIVKTLFGVGRYLSSITSFEIEPPTNKLSFGWPSHILRSLVNPNNKDIRDIPGLAPPALSRRLLWNPN